MAAGLWAPHLSGNVSTTEIARRDGVQTTPMFGILGMSTDFGNDPLLRSVQPCEQRADPKSSGIGSPVKRRAHIGILAAGGHDLSHGVKIGRSAVMQELL